MKILALILLSVWPLFAHNGAVAVAMPVDGITVDGDLSDWPDGLATHEITFPEYGDRPTSDGDLKAHFRVGHDASASLRRDGHGHTYEWVVPIGSVAVWHQTIGFDVVICDRDSDGSFTWLSWGPYSSKDGAPERVGDLLLNPVPTSAMGLVEGRVYWRDDRAAYGRARLEYRSLGGRVSGYVACSDSGVFKVGFPQGRYELSVQGRHQRIVEVRPEQVETLEFEVHDLGQDEAQGFVQELLAGAYTTAFLVDGEGRLWTGTDSALRLSDPEQRVLHNENVTSLALAQDGGVWVGTRRGGVVVYRDGRWRRLGMADGLADWRVRALASAGPGGMWVGTAAGQQSLRWKGTLEPGFLSEDATRNDHRGPDVHLAR